MSAAAASSAAAAATATTVASPLNQTNQAVSPQPNGAPAPVSNAGDQQLQTQTSTDDEPLPTGWEVHSNANIYHFNLIDLFFINLRFHSFPPLNQVRFDQFGRRYYVDHNTRST